MKKKVIVAFLAMVFVLVTVCGVTHQEETSHENGSGNGKHCCAIVPAGYALAKITPVTFFLAPFMFLLTLIFFIPSKTALNLYRPPRIS